MSPLGSQGHHKDRRFGHVDLARADRHGKERPEYSDLLALAVIQRVVPSGRHLRRRNAVWSPLSQIGWDRMEEELGGEVVKVDPPNPLISQLSSFRWDERTVMPETGWSGRISGAGWGMMRRWSLLWRNRARSSDFRGRIVW